MNNHTVSGNAVKQLI